MDLVNYNYIFDRNLSEDDPIVIKFIKEKFIVQPSTHPYYNLSDNSKKDFSMGQSEVVYRYYKQMEKLGKIANNESGFFIESGALDGETRSNTLFFEKELGWTGLLIEADPLNFEKLLQKHRKSFSVNSILCPTRANPRMIEFVQDFNLGQIKSYGSKFHESRNMIHKHTSKKLPCFSLYSTLLAIVENVNLSNYVRDDKIQVDYFSLDVEGAELEVLKTIPFDKISIKIMTVEFFHVPGGKLELEQFMLKQGFLAVDTVTNPDNLANDIVFVNNDYWDENVGKLINSV
ncbi:unnamed protein product [Gordionus sp. m RMFG-2023]